MRKTSVRLSSMRYMSRFACAGSACEDNCCHGWEIPVSQSGLAQIRRVLRKDRAALERFDGAVELAALPARSSAHFARIKVQQGTCVLLDADRLCSLQRAHGEGLLPDICRTYPRVVTVIGGERELSGTLGCPEIARQALLFADATETMELAGVAEVTDLVDEIPPSTPDLAIEILRRLHGRAHAMLGRAEFPLDSRLYFSLELLNQIMQRPMEDPQVLRIIDALEDVEVLGELSERLGELRGSLALDLDPVIAAAAGPPLEQSRWALFAQHSMPIVRSYLPADAAQSGASVTAAAMGPEYERRRAIVLAAFGARIDLILTNYCRLRWAQGWRAQLGGLGPYVRGLLLCVALLRFLLCSDLEVVAAAEDPATGGAVLDRAAVRLVYTLGRLLDNDRRAQESFASLAEVQVPSLDAAMRLLVI